MSLPDPLLAEEFHLYLLPGSQLSDQDVSIKWCRCILASEPSSLVTHGLPFKMRCIDISIIVELIFIDCIVDDHWSIRVLLCAADMQLELYAIICSVLEGRVNVLLPLDHFALVVIEKPWICFDWNESDSVRKVFIGDNRGVLP